MNAQLDDPKLDLISGVHPVSDVDTIESRRLGAIRLRELIGIGGMAEIWRGVTSDGRAVAIKLLSSEHSEDQTARRRFARECAITMSLRQTTQAAHGLDQGIRDDGRQYLVVEYLDGPTLEEFLVLSDTPLSTGHVASIIRGICRALSDFHEQEIFHRDLKPANIMLSSDGSDLKPLLIDFGISTAPDFATLTQERELLGTLQYMAPEQVYGSRISPLKIDLWGLSALTYETLVGRPAFDAPSLGELCATIRNARYIPPSELRSDLSQKVDDFFVRCFSESVCDRHSTVEQWLNEFEYALGISARPQKMSTTDYVARTADRALRFPRPPEALGNAAASKLLPRKRRTWLLFAAVAALLAGLLKIADLNQLAAQWSGAWP